MAISRILRRLTRLSVAALPLALFASSATAQSAAEDCTDAGGGPQDIKSLTGRYDPASGEVVVTVQTCGPVESGTKYRLRLDWYTNQEEYPAGSGSYVEASLWGGNPYCLGVGDAQMMWHGRPAGPGTITVSGDTLVYRVARTELGPQPLPLGRNLRFWAEAQTKGLIDRAPNNHIADGCAAPQFLDEVKQIPVVDVATVVGTQAFDLLRDPVRRHESAMGNLVADSQRFGVEDADVALVNSGGLRSDIACSPPSSGEQVCEITWGELFSVLPFGNIVVLETVTGAQLEAALVNGLSPACNSVISTGRFPQVSGLQVSFSCAGSSVVINTLSLTPDGIGGTAIPIGPTDKVRLVTNDFLYTGGDGYTALMGGTDVVILDRTLLELFADYVSAESPVAPVVEGRIVPQP